MELVIHVPNDMSDPVNDKLAALPTGVLEAVALDAVLRLIGKLGEGDGHRRAPD